MLLLCYFRRVPVFFFMLSREILSFLLLQSQLVEWNFRTSLTMLKMRRGSKLSILLFPKFLCAAILFSWLLAYMAINRNFLGDPGVAYLPCGPVDLRGTFSLFETRSRLSCTGRKTDPTESVSWSHPSHLICHVVPAATFEPINTIYAMRAYKKISNCTFSNWQNNISLESALTNIDPLCLNSVFHDRPVDNCKISNVMFEEGRLIGLTSAPSLVLKIGNFITIERKSRRIDRIPRSLRNRVQNLKPTTLKLPITLLPLRSAKPCGTMLWGKTILIHRWHPDSIYHLMESLYRLYSTLKLHNLLGQTIRIVNLDPLEGTQAMFMGHTVHRSGIESNGRFKYEELLYAFSSAIFHMDMFEETPVCFEHAIVVGYAEFSLGLFSKKTSDLEGFRDFLLQKLKLKSNSSRSRQITLLSRSNILGYGETSLERAKQRRHIVNEEELATYLRKNTAKSVEIVKLNELTIRAQILLMFRTEILISIHSAALINMLWLQPGSAVIQIFVEGTHLGSNSMLTRNHLLVRECGASFHMVTPVESMASSLKLKYAEMIIGGRESKLNQVIDFCENIENRDKLSTSCCHAFENEERLHRFAEDFFVDKTVLLDIVEQFNSI